MIYKIFIASRFLTQPITGVQRYALGLSMAIRQLDEKHRLSFISPRNIIHHDASIFLGVKQIGYLQGHLWDQISVLRFLKSQGNPLVINFANTLPLFYPNKLVTIHDIIYAKYPLNNIYSKYYRFAHLVMLKHARHIITVSEFSKKEISAHFHIDENKISVVYNAVDGKFKPQLSHQHKKYILGVSTIAYHKNYFRLLLAFSRLQHKYIQLKIVGGINHKIFGMGDLQIIRQVSDNHNVEYLGRVDDDKLIELYSNACCFVYPSLYEGFGLPPLEAQACGCPVILSDIPVFREVYGDSAIYVDPYSPEDIAEKIQMLLDDERLRDILIQNGFENAKKYTWENSAKSFFKVLDKISLL